MCRRQAQEAQTPQPLRRRRSLAAQCLLPLAEKQRRVLRNLRRLESLGVVSARDGYQGLVDELAKVTARAWARVCMRVRVRACVCLLKCFCVHVCACVCVCTCWHLKGGPLPGKCPPKLVTKRLPKGPFGEKGLKVSKGSRCSCDGLFLKHEEPWNYRCPW